MLGIYLLVSIFTQLTPQNLLALESVVPVVNSIPKEADAARLAPGEEIAIEFRSLNGLKVGSAVLYEGKLVGEVSAISAHRNSVTGIDMSDPQAQAFEVKARLTQEGVRLKYGAVALIKAPFSPLQKSPKAVVEFLQPLDSVRNTPSKQMLRTLVGYSSFHEFWTADLSRRGIDERSFQLS